MASQKQIKQILTKEYKQREAQIAGALKSIEVFISSRITDIIDDIDPTDPNALARLGSLITEIKQSGLSDELANITRLYGKEIKRAVREFKTFGIEANLAINRDTIEALINFKTQQIENKIVDSLGNVKPLVAQSIITGVVPDKEDIKRVAGGFAHNVETELNTGLKGFSRTVTKATADRLGLDKFLYIGPDDDITRKFCKRVLNGRNPPVYTEDEILMMDNEQGLDVFQFGGGYNCRHDWRPVSNEFAAELTE